MKREESDEEGEYGSSLNKATNLQIRMGLSVDEYKKVLKRRFGDDAVQSLQVLPPSKEDAVE